jgi:hypothetical protein
MVFKKSRRQIENRTCLFRFCHSPGDLRDIQRTIRGEYGPERIVSMLHCSLDQVWGEDVFAEVITNRSSVLSSNPVSNKVSSMLLGAMSA